MQIQVLVDKKTERTRFVSFQSDTFVDERILNLLHYSLANGVVLKMYRNDDMVGEFCFGQRKPL